MRMSQSEAITQEFVKSILDYEKETGVFFWKERANPAGAGGIKRFNSRCAGQIAGRITTHGYRVIPVKKNSFVHQCFAHRLAWLYSYGEWPEGVIDHIDRDSLNNAISNLRAVTQLQNIMNSRICKRNTSGVKGVSWVEKYNHWVVRISSFGKQVHVGCYGEKTAAIKARKEAEVKYWGASECRIIRKADAQNCEQFDSADALAKRA